MADYHHHHHHLLGTIVASAAANDGDLYPPVVITADALCSRSASPLPMIDPTLLLRPSTAQLTVLSPRHLCRATANASPSVNSWAGAEISHNHQSATAASYPRQSHRHQMSSLFSEPNMMMANTKGVLSNSNSSQRGIGSYPAAAVTSSSSIYHDNVESFRKSSPATGGAGRGCGGDHRQRRMCGRQVGEEMEMETTDDGSQEQFMDNLNIDELFLLGSVSQQNLVGKKNDVPFVVKSPRLALHPLIVMCAPPTTVF